MQFPTNKGQYGITLVELLFASLLLAIIVSWGTASFSAASKNSRATAYTNSVISTLHYARSEASANFQSQIVMCPSASSTACTNANWEAGWIVYHDRDLDGQMGEKDEILRVVNQLHEGVTLRTIGFPGNQIIYGSRGMPNAIGTLILCDDRGPKFAKGVIVRATGRPRLASDENGDGIVNTHLGVEGNAPCPS